MPIDMSEDVREGPPDHYKNLLELSRTYLGAQIRVDLQGHGLQPPNDTDRFVAVFDAYKVYTSFMNYDHMWATKDSTLLTRLIDELD